MDRGGGSDATAAGAGPPGQDGVARDGTKRPPAPAGVFITYRREDASGFAGRLHESLTKHFGPDRIFRDINSIEVGADFGEAIDGSLGSCAALVVVIGREWLVDLKGRRRLDNPKDWVRLEIAAAIERNGVMVIPVLVEGVGMPSADDLPEPLKPLTRYNALELSDSRWDFDVARLVKRLETAVARSRHPLLGRIRPALAWKGGLGGLTAACAVVAVTVGAIAGVRAVANDPAGSAASLMTGDFNIVVAPFAVSGPGDPEGINDVLTLADSVYEHLDTDLRDISPDIDVQIRPPDQSSPVAGATAEQRAAVAAARARDVNAHLVVYGTVELGNPTGFQPEFFVANQKLGGAEELFGQYDLGSAIRAPGDAVDNLVARAELRKGILGRVQALAEFVVGLSYYTANQPGPALAHFAAARSNAGWDDRDGKEVVHIFIGNAAAKLGDIDTASDAYDQAVALNPEYARGRLGQAEIAFQRSRSDCEQGEVDEAGLHRAAELFHAALAARDRPSFSDVPIKATFGAGRVHLCLTQALVGDFAGPAEAEFKQVIDEFERGNRRLRELAAESHAGLGLVHWPPADDPDSSRRLEQVAADYQRALDVTAIDSRKALFHSLRGAVFGRLGDGARAGDEYRQAVALEPDPTTREGYEKALQALGAS